MTWDELFNWLMDQEGRTITNVKGDSGGLTCWGISRVYHPNWAGWELVDKGVTSGPALEALISGFYREQYQELWRGFPERLREVMVDTAVNMGNTYAVQCLQDALNRLAGSQYVHVDGVLGKQTMEAVKHANQNSVAFAMCAVRMAEYARRAAKSPTKRMFLQGWLNRVSRLMAVI
jgi:lysozyme family protein